MSRTILTEVNGFTPVIDAITKAHGLVTSAVFGRMWRYCQMFDGVCKASQETIAADLGLSRKTVNEHIEVLVQAGFLEDKTPASANRTHVYADTGKANIKASLNAGVTESYSKPEFKAVAVTQSYSSVTQGYSGCNGKLQPGVTQSYTNDSSLRDSLTDKKKENLWQSILQQLRGDVGMADYSTWVQPLKAVELREGVLRVEAVNAYGLQWCADHLGKKVNGLASAIAGEDVKVAFVMRGEW